MFPFYKKATAIGICNFISRFFTIFASLVSELDKPVPGIVLLVLIFIAFINSLFLPSIADEEELERKMNEGVDGMSEKESEKKDD